MFTSLGLMSGTSGDGVDASIINSDGISKFDVIKNKYFEYDNEIYKQIHALKDEINTIDDLKKFSKELNHLERTITLFHAKIINEFKIIKDNYIVGFHGQTIYHNPKEQISKQLGDAKLLYQLTKKKIIFNFRENDILNGGEGAPLTPLFHQLIVTKSKINFPTCILNIGGISNATIIKEPIGSFNFESRDLGPGNCLIDTWIRKNSKHKFDFNGNLASNGKVNEIILEQAIDLYTNRIEKNKNSFDVSDFDISFARGLSLEDGTATLTDFTAKIISDELSAMMTKSEIFDKINEIFVCGGGRKNNFLIDKIRKKILNFKKIKLVDNYNIDGDYVESQAFAFLAIRSILNLPISFPTTTRCLKPISGGEIIEY